MDCSFQIGIKRNHYYFLSELSADPIAAFQDSFDQIKITPERNDFFKKIWDIYQYCLHLLSKLWPFKAAIPPVELPHHLFEDLLLANSGKMLQGEKTSAVMSYLIEFLKKEKGIPSSLIQELEKAASWAREMENIEKIPLRNIMFSKLDTLAKSIKKTIQNLKPGQSCLVPGQFHCFPQNKFVFYRITRDSNKGFCLEILSRDPSIHQPAGLPAIGKDKIAIGTKFSGLKMEEVADDLWLKSLLSFSLPNSIEEMMGAIPQPAGLAAIFERFKDKIDTTEQKEYRHFHKKREGLTRIQTLWSFVHDQIGHESTQGMIARRKLRFGLEFLFFYFDKVKNKLKDVPIAQEYLKEGIRKLSQKSLNLYRAGHLTEEELEKIYGQIKLIETTLGESCSQPVPCLSSLILPQSPRLHFPLKERKQPQPILEIKEENNETKKSGEFKGKPREAAPFFPKDVEYSKTPKKFQIDTKAPAESLEQILSSCTTPPLSEDPLNVQYLLVNVLLQLPLPTKKKPDTYWENLSVEERRLASQRLKQLAFILEKAARETQTFLPDRLLAIQKVCFVCEHLAFLNRSLTGFALSESVREFESFFKQLVVGRGSERAIYRHRKPVERSAIAVLKKYEKLKDKNRYKQTSSFMTNEFLAEKRFNSFPESTQKWDLKELADLLNQLTKADLLNARKNLNSWGRPIENEFLRAAATHIEVGEGIDGDPKKGYLSSKYPEYTQEAMMDNPKRVLQNAWFKWVNKYKFFVASKRETPPPFPQDWKIEDVKELLLTMHPETAVWSLLGLMNEHPLVLLNSDFCSVIEFLLHEEGNLAKAINRNPEVLNLFGDLLRAKAAYFKSQNLIEPFLFLIHLSRSLKEVLSDSEEETLDEIKLKGPPSTIVVKNLDPRILPSFEKEIKGLTLGCLVADSPLYAHRNAILTEYFYLFYRKETLDQAEIKDFILYYYIWKNSPVDPKSYNGIVKDRIEEMMREWKNVLVEALEGSDSLLSHCLDRICEIEKIPLPAEPWQGQYPYYRSGGIEINLSNSTLRRCNDKKLAFLPPELLHDDNFPKAFPAMAQKQPLVTNNWIENGKSYSFLDHSGLENRVEVDGKSIVIFKKNPERESWLCLIPFRDLDPFIEKYPFLRNHCLYSSESNSNEFYSFDKEGFPQFKIIINEKATLIEDLRNDHPSHQGLAGIPLAHLEDSPLDVLKNFVDPSQIIIWTENNKIKEIEFYGYGLNFEMREDKLYCKTPGFEHYHLELASHVYARGLPGLLLISSEDNLAKKLILPKFSGGLVREFDESDQFRNFAWRHQLSEPHFFVYNYVPAEEAFRPAETDFSIQPVCDLLRYGISLVAVNPNVIQTILYNLSEIEHHVSIDNQEALLDCVSWMANFALNNHGTLNEPHPETVGLTLKTLFILKHKVSNKHVQAIDHLIAQLAPAYFSFGTHIDLRATLSISQIQACIRILELNNPQYFAEQAKFLNAGKKEELVEVPFLKRNDFFNRQRTRAISLEKLKYSILRKYTYKEPAAPTPLRMRLAQIFLGITQFSLKKADPLFLSRSFETYTERFSEIYEICKSAPVDGAEFQKLHLSLKVLAAEGEPSDEFYVLTTFLETIFDLRLGEPAVALPNFPDLNFPENDSNMSYEKKEEIRKIRKRSEKDLTVFLANLSKIIESKQNTKTEKNAQIVSEVPKISFDRPLEMLEIEQLEKRLREIPPPDAGLSFLDVQKNDCLFTPEAIKQFFVTGEVENPLEHLKLEELESHQEPCVRQGAKKLMQKLSQHADQRESERNVHLKDDAALMGLQEMVAKQSDQLQKEKQAKREEILALVQDQNSLIRNLEIVAGYVPEFKWDDLYYAFANQDFCEIEKKYPHIDRQNLNTLLREYFVLDVNCRFIHRIIDELKQIEAQKEILVKSVDSGNKIFEMLTRCRAYDSAQHPQFLALESLMGFIISQEQMEVCETFAQNPSAIRRLKTGIGKSSLVVLLACLMQANGTNLVTLKFLDSLYGENSQHVQKILGTFLKRPVTPLLFSMNTPMRIQKRIHGQTVEFSVFERMYKQCLVTAIGKGCLVTDRRSMPLLEAKFISLLDKISNAENFDVIDQMDVEHLKWLSKILILFRERQESLYDEHDKFLFAKEEIHLRLGDQKPVPKFIWKTIIKIFDPLQKNQALGLRQNLQAEAGEDTRKKARNEVAQVFAKKWGRKLGFKKNSKEVSQLQAYFNGEDDQILKVLDEREGSEELLDQIALIKDILLIYLPITLSRAGNQNYIRSVDGQSVIPCDYTDVPREGSEFEEIRERIPYFIQYYYQEGVSLDFLKGWINDLKNQALEEMEKNLKLNINHTRANRLFRKYFPNYSLSSLVESDVEILCQKVKGEPKLTRKFLKTILAAMSMSGKKITIDAHNQVSMSKASAGMSATQGCVEGFHRQFDRTIEDKKEETKSITATMLARFCGRMNDKKLKIYNPAEPKTILTQLKEQIPDMAVVIDGAGALWGNTGETLAENIYVLTGQRAVGSFNQAGKPILVGDKKARLDEKGQLFPQAQARGANVKLSVSKQAVLLANGRTPLEEICQNEGRLREDSQPMAVAVPITANLEMVSDLVNKSLVVECVDRSELTHRSKKQEQRDIVRNKMMVNLLTALNVKGLETAVSLYKQYRSSNILVTENNNQNWNVKGSYYRQNKFILRKDASAVEDLAKRKNSYIALTDQLDLEAKSSLEELDYGSIADQMPAEVFQTDLNFDCQVEIETQTTVETQVETLTTLTAETEVEALPQEDYPYYLAWRNHYDKKYKIHSFSQMLHPAYDPRLQFSENFLPLYRNTWANPIFHRQAHDTKQNRLHYVRLQFDYKGFRSIEVKTITAYDLNDVRWGTSQMEKHTMQEDIYDVKTGRFVSRSSTYRNFKVPPFDDLIAQMKFEDGQFENYSENEFRELEKWIRSNDPIELEKYFKNEVLKNRPRDLESYKCSPLKDLFEKIIKTTPVIGNLNN